MNANVFLANRDITVPLLDRYRDVGCVELHIDEEGPDDIQLTEPDANGIAIYNVMLTAHDKITTALLRAA